MFVPRVGQTVRAGDRGLPERGNGFSFTECDGVFVPRVGQAVRAGDRGLPERGIEFSFTECDDVFVPRVGPTSGAGGGGGSQREGLSSHSLSVTVCLSSLWDRLWKQGVRGASERGIGFLFTECDGVFVPRVGQTVRAGDRGQRERLSSHPLSGMVCLSPGWDRL